MFPNNCNRVELGQAAVVLAIVNGIRKILPMNPFLNSWNIQDGIQFPFPCGGEGQGIVLPYVDPRRSRFQYQSEVFVRQQNSYADHSQQEPNFPGRTPQTNPQLNFRPPDRRFSRTIEPSPDVPTHRSLKNQRRRKSHLDDIYGPNFEDYQEKEYRKERYHRWDQSERRSSVLKPIERSSSKFEYSKVSTVRNGRDESRSARQSSLSTGNIRNNPKESSDSQTKVSGISEKTNVPNATNSSDKTNFQKISTEEEKSKPEMQEKSLNSTEIKPNSEKSSEIVNKKPIDVNISESHSVRDTVQKEIGSPGSVDVTEKIDESPNEKIKMNIQFPLEKSLGNDRKVTTEPKDPCKEKNMSKSVEKVVSCERRSESDEETVCCNDFISIDQIDTKKSFLHRSPADDYRVVDMDIDGQIPDKTTKIGDSRNMTQPKDPEINSDKLLSALNDAIDTCNIKTVDVGNERFSSFKNRSAVYPETHNGNNKPSKTVEKHSKTKEMVHSENTLFSKRSFEKHRKDKKNSSDRSKRKLEKHRYEEKKNVGKRKSTDEKKMSSVYYSSLANYTIPKLKSGKSKFLNSDEPYMNKMQSLFGIDEDEDGQLPIESAHNDKSDSKKNDRKRSSTDEEHPQSKRKCTNIKTSKASKETYPTNTKHEAKHSRDKDTSKTSRSTNRKDNAKETQLNKTKQVDKLAESVKLSNKDSESSSLKEKTKLVKMKVNKRRYSETVSCNKKLITERRFSLPLNDSTEVKQNKKSEKSQLKISTGLSNENVDTPSKEKDRVSVKLACDLNNPDKQIKAVEGEKDSSHDKSNESISEKPIPVERYAISNDSKSIDNKRNEMNSQTNYDEISNALSKIFESDTSMEETASESMKNSKKVATSKVISDKDYTNSSESLTECNSEDMANDLTYLLSIIPDNETSQKVNASDSVPCEPTEIHRISNSDSDELSASSSVDKDCRFIEVSGKTSESDATNKHLGDTSAYSNSIDEVDEVENKPTIEYDDSKPVLSGPEIRLYVKTAVKCELLGSNETCRPLVGLSLPPSHRVQSTAVYGDCSEKASILDSPEVKESTEMIKISKKCSDVQKNEKEMKSTTDNEFDDIIEIRPIIPIIDLTNESFNTKSDSEENLLGLLDVIEKSGENITIYRSDETSNNSLDVQAMSASILPKTALVSNTFNKIESGIDETTVGTIPKVEPDVPEDFSAVESNEVIPSEDTNTLTFASNVQTLVSQLEDSHPSDVPIEISENRITISSEDTITVTDMEGTVLQSRSAPVIRYESNEGLFLHPELIDNSFTRRTMKTSNSKKLHQNTILKNTFSSPLQTSVQTVGQNESDCIAKLTKFVYPEIPQNGRQESRSYGAQLMQPSMSYGETNSISHPSDLNVGKGSSDNDMSQNSNRTDVNTRTKFPRLIQDSVNPNNLTRREWSMAHTIAPYIHLIACIRKNHADSIHRLKTDLLLVPELLRIELKLSDFVYLHKLQIYSGYIVEKLRAMNLSGYMNAVTANAIVDCIFLAVQRIDSTFSKSSVILYLEHLVEPQNSFYGSSNYLKPFYNHIKFLCKEISRRAPPPYIRQDASCGQITPDQRKILEYQIQQYNMTLNFEKSRLSNSFNYQMNTRSNDKRPVTTERVLFSILKSTPTQTNNRVPNTPAHSPMTFRSPAHIPEGIMNSPAHASVESMQRKINNGAIPSSPANFRSPTGNQMPPSTIADYTNISNVSFNSSTQHAFSLTGSSQNRSSGARLTTIAQPMTSPGHRSEGSMNRPSPYPSTSNRSQFNNTSLIVPGTPKASTNFNSHASILASVSRSPAHEPETSLASSSSGHFPVASTPQPQNLVSISSPSYASASIATKLAILRSERNQEFVVPKQPPTKHKATNSSPETIPMVHMSPSRLVDHASTVSATHTGNFAMSPKDVSPRSSNMVQSSPRSFNMEHSSPRASDIVQSTHSGTDMIQSSPRRSELVQSTHTTPEIVQRSPRASDMIQNSPRRMEMVQSSPMASDMIQSSPRAPGLIQNSPNKTPACATPSQATMPNLIDIRTPVYAPMLFSPPNYVQDEPDDPLDEDDEVAQNSHEKESENNILETIDLTWLDQVDEEQIQKEIEFIVVKKEEPDDEEVILNKEQFPVIPSPADSGIESPYHQEECSELVYLNRSCICENTAEYLCRCRMVMYCSTSCQTKDWKDHKSICVKYTAKKTKDNN